MAVNEPHILLAKGNCRKIVRNLAHLLDTGAQNALEQEIRRNAKALFMLGEKHRRFAQRIARTEWRQRISRLYYAAFNFRRAATLVDSGNYSQESKDHQNTDLPAAVNDSSTYTNLLISLRTDRNLADYDHDARVSDLLRGPDDAEVLVRRMRADIRTFLVAKGVSL